MNIHSFLSFFTWNPNREAFHVPFIDRPIYWYGILFILGFIVGYWIVIPMLAITLRDANYNPPHLRAECQNLADRLTWYVILGALVGARLGHVFFYSWPMYKAHPLDIFKVWEGGLASHGGIIGILIALFLFRLSTKKSYPSLTYLKIVDILCVPGALGGVFIRLGNFMNQEILGTPTNAPWAVLFLNPADHSSIVPRHPVQLYEALAYLGIFILLTILWRIPSIRSRTGFIAGVLFVSLFSARYLLENFKESQDGIIDETWISTGQFLSIPFIVLGLILMAFAYKKKPSALDNSKN